ncbi:integral membrane protein GPR180-like isoform X2 [Apostichopus japonicus]
MSYHGKLPVSQKIHLSILCKVIIAFIVGLQFFQKGTEAKSARGNINTVTAAKSFGHLITNFCFTVGTGRLFYQLNTTSAPGQVYLYPENVWQQVRSSEDCGEKIKLAQHRVDLFEKEGNFSMLHFEEQGTWVAMYAPADVCNLDASTMQPVYLAYHVQIFNTDSHGVPSNQFSCEDTGLLGFYELLAFLYFVIGCMCAPSLWETLQKQGPMHDVLSMLTKVLCLQASAALCMCIHLYRFARDGEGSSLAENLSEVLEICAQFGMLYMMLSLALGWTLSTSKTEVNSKIWKKSPHAKIVGSLAAVQCICIILEQLFSSSHSMYHDHQSILGILALILRTVLAVLFANYLYQVVSKERSVVRKLFYKGFATYCFLWFLAYPVILLVSTFLNEARQKMAVVFGVTISQSIAVVMLYRLFLSRSLYWEISALSSASLPLRLDIKNFDNKSKK